MAEIIHLLERLKKDGVEQYLSHPDLEIQADKIKVEIDNLATDKQVDVRNLLNDILDALDDRMVNLASEIQMQKSNIHNVQQNTQACIAYSKHKNGETR